MGSAADYTMLVMLVVIGVALWTVIDRLGTVQRELEDLRRKFGPRDDPPA